MKRIYRWLIAIFSAVISFGPCMAVQSAPQQSAQAGAKKAGASWLVQGRVKAATRAPRPGSVPYKDAVIALHLTSTKVLRGRAVARDIVVFVWGMRHNKRTRAASFRPGQVVTLPLTPWEKAERKYGSYNRFELQGDETLALDTYWGEQ